MQRKWMRFILLYSVFYFQTKKFAEKSQCKNEESQNENIYNFFDVFTKIKLLILKLLSCLNMTPTIDGMMNRVFILLFFDKWHQIYRLNIHRNLKRIQKPERIEGSPRQDFFQFFCCFFLYMRKRLQQMCGMLWIEFFFFH